MDFFDVLKCFFGKVVKEFHDQIYMKKVNPWPLSCTEEKRDHAHY